MRVELPVMVIVSLALHGVIATGVIWGHSHTVTASLIPAATEAQTTTLILLGSEETPDRQPAAPSKTAAAQPAVANAPVALPAPPQPAVEKPTAVTPPTPPPTLALEANPNANVRPLPPEEVLSPTPAPHLDNHSGVVFVLDVSGSMYEPCSGSTRLALAREILSTRIRALKDGTPFAITVYAQTAKNSGPLVAASEATREAAIRFIHEDIDCGGGTNLPAGLASARQLGTGSLVLVSDGDLNINLGDLMNQSRSILGVEGHCPALTVVAVSPRPNTDAKSLLQGLVDLEGGTYRSEKFNNTELLTSNRSISEAP